jgi:hypothetical protein
VDIYAAQQIFLPFKAAKATNGWMVEDVGGYEHYGFTA